MPIKDHHKMRQELRAAALRRMSRLKITAITISVIAFGGLSGSIASQSTFARSVATSAVSSTRTATSAATPTTSSTTTTTQSAATTTTATPTTTSQPIVSAQS
jgi:hypothetical protein